MWYTLLIFGYFNLKKYINIVGNVSAFLGNICAPLGKSPDFM